jgi:hypothetical protein
MPPKKKKPGRPKKTRAKDIKKTKALVKADPKKKKDEGIEGEVIDNPENDQFGRPTVVTEDVKGFIIEAAKFGCSQAEMARHAGIALRTLTRFFEKEPDFKEFCEELTENPTLAARMTLVKKISKSAYFALKYLERKKSDEFSLRVKQTFDEPEPLTPEEQEVLDDVLEDNL